MSKKTAQAIDLDFLISKVFNEEDLDKIPPEELIQKLYSQTKLDLSCCNIEEISHLESMTELKSLYLRQVCNFCFILSFMLSTSIVYRKESHKIH